MPRGTFTFEGKRYSVSAKTEKELITKITLKKRDLEEGKITITGSTNVSTWADKWLKTYKQGSVGDGWYKEIERITKKRIKSEIGTIQIKLVKPIHAKKILNQCEGMSLSYATKVKNILREMFEGAKENGLILNNPADNLKIPNTKEKENRRSITEYERKHLLNVAESHRAGMFLKIMLYCGLRPSEVAVLKWKDVDIKEKTIEISSALKRGNIVGPPKSKAGYRKVPIPANFLSDLKKGSPFDYVCTQVCGKRHTETSIKQMWSSFKYRLNIDMGCKTFKGGIIPPYRVAEDLTMYCLRHTFCTDLQSAGVPINVARELMGHSDISTTSKIYTHKSEITFKNAAKLMDEFHEQNKKSHDNPSENQLMAK